MLPSPHSGECALLLILPTVTEHPWIASLLPLGIFETWSGSTHVAHDDPLLSYCLVKAVVALATDVSEFIPAVSGELSTDRDCTL